MLCGFYYLHENGDLIYKRETGGTAADIRESTFAKAMWPVDIADRKGAWDILVEGLASGAKLNRVKDLALQWKCNNADAQRYAAVIGILLDQDGNKWCAKKSDFINLQESPVGFGDTALEAMAELCKALGYRPSKLWGSKFSDLCSAREIVEK